MTRPNKDSGKGWYRQGGKWMRLTKFGRYEIVKEGTSHRAYLYGTSKFTNRTSFFGNVTEIQTAIDRALAAHEIKKQKASADG